MPSLRNPASSALLRGVARVLIAALLFAFVPTTSAEASIPPQPSSGAPSSRALPELDTSWPPASREVVVCVLVVVAGPLSLTKSAFGELLAHTGSDPQPYAFAGEPLDPNVGWQYHRARWMDPTVGRFHGMDPFRGTSNDPATLHRYACSRNDVLNRVDPSGLFDTLVSAFVGFQMFSSLASMSILPSGIGTQVAGSIELLPIKVGIQQPDGTTVEPWNDGMIEFQVDEARRVWQRAGITLTTGAPRSAIVANNDGIVDWRNSEQLDRYRTAGRVSDGAFGARQIPVFFAGPLASRVTLQGGRVHTQVRGGFADVSASGSKHPSWLFISNIAGGLVLAHELGHAFGLPNRTETGFLMYEAMAEEYGLMGEQLDQSELRMAAANVRLRSR